MTVSLSSSLPLHGLVFAIGSPMSLLRKITGLGNGPQVGTAPALGFSKISLTRDYWTFIARIELTHLRTDGPSIDVNLVTVDVLDQKSHTVKTTKLFLGAPVGHLERQKDTKELRPEQSTTELSTDTRTLAPGQTEAFTARLHIPDGKILLVQFGARYKPSSNGQAQFTKAPAYHVLGSPFEMWADEDTYSVPHASSFLNAPLEIASQDLFNGIELTDIHGKAVT